MQYVVSDKGFEQLKFMLKTHVDNDVAVEEFIKLQQSVELVAEGDIEETLEDFRAWVHEEHNKISHLEIMQGNLRMIKIFIQKDTK